MVSHCIHVLLGKADPTNRTGSVSLTNPETHWEDPRAPGTGGALIDHFGYGITFAITGCMQSLALPTMCGSARAVIE